MKVKSIFFSTLFMASAMIPVVTQGKVIENGSFENNTAWQCIKNSCENGLKDYILKFEKDGNAYDGKALLFLTDTDELGVYQDITLPTGNERPGITFAYNTLETSDRLQVTIKDLETSKNYVDDTIRQVPSDLYGMYSYVLPESVSGRTVRLQLKNVSVNNNPWVEVDDVRYVSRMSYPVVEVSANSLDSRDMGNTKIWVKDHHGKRLDLKNLSTNTTKRSIITDADGDTPKFRILSSRLANQEFTICGAKGGYRECEKFTPLLGIEEVQSERLYFSEF